MEGSEERREGGKKEGGEERREMGEKPRAGKSEICIVGQQIEN